MNTKTISVVETAFLGQLGWFLRNTSPYEVACTGPWPCTWFEQKSNLKNRTTHRHISALPHRPCLVSSQTGSRCVFQPECRHLQRKKRSFKVRRRSFKL